MDQASFLPVLNDRLVMLATGLNLYALDRLNGRLLWQIKVPKMPSGGPPRMTIRVYIGTHEGSVYAFDLRMILRLYQERLLPEYTQNTQVWRYQAGDKISSPPVSTGRSVLFASRDHSLYAVSARSRPAVSV
ncbi:MAG: PQQ-binding-like beta-propeller repeat protein [Planctomycetaceae bacterium]